MLISFSLGFPNAAVFLHNNRYDYELIAHMCWGRLGIFGMILYLS